MDLAAIEADGFVILENCLTNDECQAWGERVLQAIDQDHLQGRLQANSARPHRELPRDKYTTTPAKDTAITYGSRNLLSLCPDVVQLLMAPKIFAACKYVLGSEFGVVRGLYFDKPPGLSWSLPWHQDLTIAVAEHVDGAQQEPKDKIEGYSKPTTKAGTCHVEAPQWLLEKMLTVRIHLDEMNEENGPVVVRKGSHRSGKNLQEESPIEREITEIHCGQGAAMLMRPLLSHSSIACKPDSQSHRRTIHLELSSTKNLTCSYRWKDYVPVF